ncbi:hypothetical protein SDC9_175692 [bioreactor metagenome]|uniref:Uncharacterized protein n=1 Tax=bioreactor metagenome TaxID=1076179 RepID=A0A645GMS0_9ZZZZ
MGYLVDVARELARYVQKRHYDADAEHKPGDAQVVRLCEKKYSSRHRDQNVDEVADVHENGSEYIGKFVG